MNFNQAWMARFGWPNIEDLHLPLAIAHRGASDYRMENTLKAFQLAAELGAEMWELDVRLSKDGVVVVCHDETLKFLLTYMVLMNHMHKVILEDLAF